MVDVVDAGVDVENELWYLDYNCTGYRVNYSTGHDFRGGSAKFF